MNAGSKVILLWTPGAEDVGESTITIEANDGIDTVQQTFKVNVINTVNDPPTDITLTNTTLASPSNIGDIVGQIDVVDLDGPFSILSLEGGVGDDHNHEFSIVGNVLRANVPFTGSETKKIRVKVFDGGFTFEKAFTISVVFADADNDGIADSVDLEPNDASISGTKTDFSDTVDAMIGFNSGFSSVEDNLKLWIDATNVNGNNNRGIVNGSEIATWVDLSGNGNHKQQADTNYRPTYQSNAVLFANDFLYSNQVLDLYDNNYAIYAVIKPNDTYYTLFYQGAFDAGNTNHQFMYNGSNMASSEYGPSGG